jgi:hypothetical protein
MNRPTTTGKSLWPNGKRFAFTVFDDTDRATLENVGGVYAFLADRGFRTTKSVWVVAGDPGRGKNAGQTCADPDYLRWLLDLQAAGFEIGLHNGTWHGLRRDAIRAALDRFAELFGHDPKAAANHTDVEDAMYFGDARLTAWRRLAYNLLTRFHNRGKYRGHVEGDPHFWGDLCKARIKYLRNFVYRDVNTLAACPLMPYHDPRRPYVNGWFASCDGANCGKFNQRLCEAAQDRLEEEGGACIMYTHFAAGFSNGGRLNPRFQTLMERLATKNGWFVPVGELLDHLAGINGRRDISAWQRQRLECKWLWEKIRSGSDENVFPTDQKASQNIV